jgi:hypothetical protein
VPIAGDNYKTPDKTNPPFSGNQSICPVTGFSKLFTHDLDHIKFKMYQTFSYK